MGKPFDFPIHKLCKQILSKVTALPDTIAAVKTAVADMAKYVVTNNTAKKDGIISQKISYLIQSNETHGSLEKTTAGSQSWTCPAGVYFVFVIICGGAGGGGGGGRGSSDSGSSYDDYGGAGCGGGSGSASQIVYALCAVTPGKSYNLVVGTGGTAGKGGNANAATMTDPTDGGNGSESNFGNMVYAKGGNGGKKGLNGWSTDYSSNIPASYGGAGGTANNSYNGTMLKQFFVNFIASTAGKEGAKGSRYNYNSEGAKQAAGGSSVSNGIKKSGAGGAGGLNWSPWGSGKPTNEPLLNGSNGAAGEPGYIKIMW